MSKGLEDFKELKKTTCFYCQYHINEECVNDKCIWNNVEKELKALEIIVSKRLNVDEIYHKDYEWYMLNHKNDDKSLIPTKEEFNLLKEVLL